MIDEHESLAWGQARGMPRAAVYYIRTSGSRRPTREQIVAWSLVGILHAWLLHTLVTHSRWRAEDAVDQAIEVSFITSAPTPVWAQPAWPQLPTRPVDPATSQPARRSAELHVQQDEAPVTPPPARLLDADGRPLAPAVSEFEAWDDADWISRNRIAQVPGGSDSQASYKVALRMRQALTPQRVVMAVLQFLFGRPSLDDCRAIEGRLLVSDPGVSREIDLHKFRQTCGG